MKKNIEEIASKYGETIVITDEIRAFTQIKKSMSKYKKMRLYKELRLIEDFLWKGNVIKNNEKIKVK